MKCEYHHKKGFEYEKVNMKAWDFKLYLMRELGKKQ